MKKYPLKMAPVYKDIIWGGTRLCEKYGKHDDTKSKIAESWELALHPEGVCKIANGEYAGMGLDEYLGTTEFPSMIKLIDAADRLSIQVHPAKTEMWYIVEADEDAELVYGLKSKFDEAEFRRALDEGRAEELLNYVKVKPGDVYFIPTGLVHAIGRGILIAEIQQNSNVTYRLYDYGRLQNGKPRELHIDAAMSVIRDFEQSDIDAIRYECKTSDDPTLVASCKYFTVNKYEFDGSLTLEAGDSFVHVLCLEGEGDVDGEKIRRGDSYFIPEGYGNFTVTGKGMKLITTRK